MVVCIVFILAFGVVSAGDGFFIYNDGVDEQEPLSFGRIYTYGQTCPAGYNESKIVYAGGWNYNPSAHHFYCYKADAGDSVNQGEYEFG